jgi:DNA-binding response OmpR family regulator
VQGEQDRDVVAVVEAILADEGYAVASLYDLSDDAFRPTIGELEPDAVLLDGLRASYGGSWDLLEHREAVSSFPVVMFTAHRSDAAEAEAG